MMDREKLKLVTDFGSLKAGDLVVLTPCKDCGGRHRFVLLSLYDGEVRLSGGETAFRVGWTYAPAALCDRPPYCVLGDGSVKRRALFLVDTGLDREETTETSKPLEHVR